MTEWLHFHFSLLYIGKGNGNPLQCSCLENPRDGGAWWAAIYGVAQSQTWLKWLSSSSSSPVREFRWLCCCSVIQSWSTLCNPMDCSTPGLPILCHLPEFALTHVHWENDAIQTIDLLSPSSPSALNLSQHQGLFQWVSSSHQVAKVLGLQHQSFQLIFRVDFL